MAWADPEARRAYDREWSKKNSKKRQTLNKLWTDKRVAWLREYKATLKCERCGENHPAALQFHHPDPSAKEGNIANRNSRWSIERVMKEIAKCIVLCANCHAKEHWNDRNFLN